MSVTAWLTVAVFAAVYVLIATEWVHRVAAALGGAVVMLLIGATDAEHAFFSEHAGIDWNVLFLLLGMMLIVAVLKRTGIFEFIAIWAARRARGRPYRLMVLLIVATGSLSAWLDNVTTVLLVAPVTILVCRRLGVPVVPYLIAEVMACNIGGAATLIGDPPNIMIGSRADLSFNDFLIHMTPVVVVLMIVFVLMSRVMFRKAFRYDPERAASVMELSPRGAIKDVRLLVVSGVVIVAVMACLVLHTWLGLEPSVVAISGGLLLLGISRIDPGDVVRDVEWETLAFFTGLFVMVGDGADRSDRRPGRDGRRRDRGDLQGTAMALVFGSVVPSAVIDNIPFVASVSPIVAEIVASSGGGEETEVLWWAFALGADLGGNATIIASSANVVVVGIAEREGHHISFWQFSRYGLIVTAVTVALAGAAVREPQPLAAVNSEAAGPRSGTTGDQLLVSAPGHEPHCSALPNRRQLFDILRRARACRGRAAVTITSPHVRPRHTGASYVRQCPRAPSRQRRGSPAGHRHPPLALPPAAPPRRGRHRSQRELPGALLRPRLRRPGRAGGPHPR
ncbi:ArsB/NhaD family transporter (plasmid) [Streptomyces chartreusis]|uniref:SLC13 family permease n=1 Tax=Streptomyces chartreusis TaxID=1969 RepID=UPI002F9154E3|nr:ArsB/NhaD family transporter [Streptomyces chartreusis]